MVAGVGQMLEQGGPEFVHRPPAGGGRRPSGATALTESRSPGTSREPLGPDPAVAVAVAEAEAGGDDRRGERSGQLRAQLGAGSD